MIGQLTFWMSSKRHTVTLDEQLRWGSDDPKITEFLNEVFTIASDESISNLALGRYALYRAAERLNGRVDMAKHSNSSATA
ncbi:MAG: hypothetical protein AAGA25_16690 [Planctomycetota bacterium]